MPQMFCPFAAHWWFYIYCACTETSIGTFISITPGKFKRYTIISAAVSFALCKFTMLCTILSRRLCHKIIQNASYVYDLRRQIHLRIRAICVTVSVAIATGEAWTPFCEVEIPSCCYGSGLGWGTNACRVIAIQAVIVKVARNAGERFDCIYQFLSIRYKWR